MAVGSSGVAVLVVVVAAFATVGWFHNGDENVAQLHAVSNAALDRCCKVSRRLDDNDSFVGMKLSIILV